MCIRDRFYQCTAEFIFRFGRCGETYLDLLEAYCYKHLEKFELFFKIHRNYKRLISVTQIDTAPYRSLVYVLDVYKRQPVEGKMVAALRRLGFNAVFDTNFGADLTIMEESHEFLDRVTTVSYTHLDVYKRQEHCPINLSSFL